MSKDEKVLTTKSDPFTGGYEKQTDMSGGWEFYGCSHCNSVVSPWDIKEHHGCAKCGGTKIAAIDLTLWRKLVQIIKHPKIWDWKNV